MTFTEHDFEMMKDKRGNFHEFFDVVKDDLGITDNPKADLMMSIAWQKGHSGGYYEVYLIALELVELIR
jgi:hypothetical protein